MQEFQIRFHSFRDVQDFVSLAAEHSFPIVVGNESYQVNGTSFMGMFSLDYSQPLTVRVTCTEEEINEFCMVLPRYKRPKKIFFDTVPRNPTGKIEKPALREKYCGKRLVEAQITG